MRGILSALSLLALIAAPAASPATAGTIPVAVDFDASSVRLTEAQGGVICVGASGQSTGWFEMPSLPYTVISVLLPQGEDVVSYRLETGTVRELIPSVSLEAFTGLPFEDGTVQGLSAPRSELVDKDSIFPRWRVRHTGTSTWNGYRIATFEVYPVRYQLTTGRLTVDDGMTLVVETEPATRGAEAIRQRHVDGFRERARSAVSEIVANPGDAAGYLFDEIVVDPGDRGFMPSYLPGLEGSAVTYVIVTNEEMSAEYQRLADWKTKKGVPTVVRTIEWIEQNYRSGADIAETVRNFVRAAYEKWGVEYVLLGGDTDVIPARFAYTTFYTGDFIPTDMYYSCLDGDWNADGDSLWGEAYHSIADPGDDGDMYAEVFCGRFPTSTVIEARTLIDKTITYESAEDRTYQDRALLLGEVIFPSDYTPGETIILDGAEILESVYDAHLAVLPDVTATRLYENYPGYPGSAQLTTISAKAAMNTGMNHVMHAGHGYKYNMSVGNGSLLNYDAYSLTNGDQIFSMFLMNCTNVAFDTDCLAEYFMLNPNGGAFAVTGSSRSAFPSASRPYMDEYYSLIYDEAVVQLGRAFTLSREPFTPAAFGETADRWTHFIYNFLGDPEANMFRGTVDTFVVSTPPSVVFGENNVTITVSSGGAPYDSALVCLYKSGDDYVYGATGPSGQVNFPDFLVRSGGNVTVTVTGLGHARYTTTIPVTLESDPFLRVSSKYIDDDIAGNNDDALDAGESVHLYVRLTNTGSTTAQKLWATVTALDPSIAMINGTSLYPNIIPGALAYGTTPFSFSVDPSVIDETPVEFRVDVHDSTGGAWSETFAFEVHAPELELFINDVSDAAPYGNGNGIIEDGESYLLKVGVKNFGSGAAYGLQGKLRSEDAGAIVTDSVSAYAAMPLLGVSYGDGFVLSEIDAGIDNHFEFELTDQYGRLFAERLELRAPGAPHALTLDASLGPDEIHVTWHPPDSTEAYSYLVYHSKTQGGPYTLASIDRVNYTLYRDRGLDASTRYYFVVAAVDSCGNVGRLSDESTTTTSPPQLAGWPNNLGKESASSPKVADVDGDTHPDIVVGAEFVYAWDGNGIELRDGDNQPLTWGIFNTEGDNFTATVALADLDGVVGAEIVGASWNTREIFVFANDGSIMPGWPKTTVDLCWASPVVGDFDGDGDLEIIAYDVDGTVYIWHVDGTELRDGDSNPATDGVFFRAGLSSQGWHVSTPALADMDDDGIVELIVCAPQDSIYCLNSNGSRVAGWPVYCGDAGANIGASPAVGDADGDGRPEVFIQNSFGRVQGINHDGTQMSGWPKWVYSNNFFAGSIGLADFTGDGKLEIVVPGMNSLCYFFRYNGAAMPGWPQPYADSGPTECSVVIADIDGDNSLDIILGSEEGRLNAWNMSGEYIPGFPIQLNGFVRGTPVVKDMDLDGDLELIATCWDQNVFVWDLDAPQYYKCIQWNGFHGNQFNSGWKELEAVTDASVTAWMYELGGGYLRLSWSIASDERTWDLLRREGDGEFELIAGGLAVDGTRTISFTDRSVEEGLVYVYRLVPSDGGEGVDTEAIEIPVATARLYQNHPNPFNPSTTLTFTVPGGADSRQTVVLGVYDVRGALVRTLVNGPVAGGRHEIAWNGTNDRGAQVASGVYFAKFMAAGTSTVKKMVLLR
jgi:hypothetical protein